MIGISHVGPQQLTFYRVHFTLPHPYDVETYVDFRIFFNSSVL
jgi:hypothetical protein